MSTVVTLSLEALQFEGAGDPGPVPASLWVTYLWSGVREPENGDPLHTMTPVADAFRARVEPRPGARLPIPVPIGSCSMEVDTTAIGIGVVGAVVVLWDESNAHFRATRAGRSTFLTAVHDGLNEMVRSWVGAPGQHASPLEVLRDSVEPATSSAIRSTLSLWEQLRERSLPMASAILLGGDELRDRAFSTPPATDTAGHRQFQVHGRLRVTS